MATISFRALGTDIFIQIVTSSQRKFKKAKIDIEKTRDIFFIKQKIFCRFWLESELSQLNKNLKKFSRASHDILYLAERALFYNRVSSGLYDPRVIEVLEKIGYQRDFRKADFSKMKIPASFDKIKRNLNDDLKIKDKEIFFGCRMDFSGIAKGYITDWLRNF